MASKMEIKLTEAQRDLFRLISENATEWTRIEQTKFSISTARALEKKGVVALSGWNAKLTDTGREYATERGWLAPVVTETPHTMDKPVGDVHEEAADDESAAVAVLTYIRENEPVSITHLYNQFGNKGSKIVEALMERGIVHGVDTGWTTEYVLVNTSAAGSSTPEAESDAPVFAVGDTVRVIGNGCYGKVKRILREYEGRKRFQVWETNNKTEFVEGEDGMYINYYAEELATATTPTSDRAIEGAVVVEAVAGDVSMIGQPRPALLGQPEHYDDVDSLTTLRDENANFVADIVRLEDDLVTARSQIAAMTGALTSAYAALDEVTFSVPPDSIHTRNLISAIRSKIWKALNAKQQNTNDSR